MEYNKINKARTNLIIEVNKDINYYLKNSKILFNSKLPKENLERYEKYQFEKKFDNPIIIGSFTGDSKMQTTIKENFIYYNLPKIISDNKLILDKDISDLQIAEFINNKKISFAHKKIKKSNVDLITNEKRKIKLLTENCPVLTKCISFNSLKFGFLNDLELEKIRILDGYERLQIMANNFKSCNKYKNNGRIQNIGNGSADKKKLINYKDYESNKNFQFFDISSPNKINFNNKTSKDYEELFELLEYKGIDISSKKDKGACRNNRNLSSQGLSINKISDSNSPFIKLKATKKVDVIEIINKKLRSDDHATKEIKLFKDEDLIKPKIEKRNFIKIDFEVDKEIRVNSANHINQPNYLNLPSQVIKENQSSRKSFFNYKIHDRETKYNKYDDKLPPLDRYLDEKKYKVDKPNSNFISSTVIDTSNQLNSNKSHSVSNETCDNFENQNLCNKNSDDKIYVSEKANSYSDDCIINLKPVEVITNEKNKFLSVSLNDFNSVDKKDFLSYNNENYILSYNQSKKPIIKRSKYSINSQISNQADNYDDNDFIMNKIVNCKEESENYNSNLYITPVNIQSEYATYNMNTVSKNSSISICTVASYYSKFSQSDNFNSSNSSLDE